MDILINVLLWLHLLGLVMGGGALIGGAIVARLLPTATGDQRSGYFGLAGVLSSIGRAGLAVLIVTGPLMLWLKWGGHAPSDTWFMVKMVLVVIVIVGVVVNGLAFKRVRNGDATAAGLAMQSRVVTSVALALVVLAAVFAFN
jgi:putative membrane protein